MAYPPIRAFAYSCDPKRTPEIQHDGVGRQRVRHEKQALLCEEENEMFTFTSMLRFLMALSRRIATRRLAYVDWGLVVLRSIFSCATANVTHRHHATIVRRGPTIAAFEADIGWIASERVHARMKWNARCRNGDDHRRQCERA
mmetsp:Transcript_4437/g.12740  ORF Transcript_4437/g.12740 Transcript_4437/m.12740 type:complete len:143 (-) Transcript_4437:387-815(-)